MVERAESHLAERGVEGETAHRRDQLLRVGRARLADRSGGGLHRAVADDGAEARIVVELRAVGVAKPLVLDGLDRVPRIARDPPADRRLVLQRIEVLGLAAEQVEHRAALEEAAQLPFAHEAGEVGAEQRREDGVGLRVEHRFDDGAGVDLAERHRLLDELDAARLQRDHLLLEGRGRGLAVLVIRVDDRPALLAELRGLGREHRRLHVGRGAEPERVPVAGLPHDLVGQRLGGEEQDLALLREVRHREADVGRERSHQQRGLFAREELLGDADRIPRIAVVVARDHLEGSAEHAARAVDLGHGELHALLVRLEERRENLVAVELAEADRLSEGGKRRRGEGNRGGDAGEVANPVHDVSSGHGITPIVLRGPSQRTNGGRR